MTHARGAGRGSHTYPTIEWIAEDAVLRVIDQRHLPHCIVLEDINDATAATIAITEMHVRGTDYRARDLQT